MMNKYNVKFEQVGMVDVIGEHEKEMEENLINLKFSEVLTDIWTFYIKPANELIDKEKPWELAIKDQDKLKAFLNYRYQNLVSISKLIKPFMPETAQKMQNQLKTLKPEPLFPKIK